MSDHRVVSYLGEDCSGHVWARCAVERRQPNGSWAEDPHLHASARIQPGRDEIAAIKLAGANLTALLQRTTAWALTARAHQGRK